MKAIFALVAMGLASSALANQFKDRFSVRSRDSWGDPIKIQRQEARPHQGRHHMVELSSSSIPRLVFSDEKTEAKDGGSQTDSSWNLGMNYAYTIHPNIQLGGRFNYSKGTVASSESEQLDISAVGWFNLTDDLANSIFASLSIGKGFVQTYGSSGPRDDLWLTAISVGKRFNLNRLGVSHLSWTPEIALLNENATTDNSFDYRQVTEFRLIQFSVIW
jgi:hypothetical protein